MRPHTLFRSPTVAALVFAAGAASAFAQSEDPGPSPDDTRFQVGVHGLVGSPLGDFSDNVDIGGHYVCGAPLRYLEPGALGAAEGVATFDERLSRTDLFTIQLGAYFEF
tara:strand:- start:145 stop:471 length:327 start_codon:yes stop_codon:yes gene_type:complete